LPEPTLPAVGGGAPSLQAWSYGPVAAMSERVQCRLNSAIMKLMLRRRRTESGAQASPAEPGRYEGRPFLRILELYVLNAAGVLPEGAYEQLRAMEPKLRETYNRPGLTWVQIVEAEMEFPDTRVDSLRSMWERTTANTSGEAETVDAEAWARLVSRRPEPHLGRASIRVAVAELVGSGRARPHAGL
jgi:hypothetical protein